MLSRLRACLQAPADLPPYRGFELIISKAWELFWLSTLSAAGLIWSLHDALEQDWLIAFGGVVLVLGGLRVAWLQRLHGQNLDEARIRLLERIHAAQMLALGGAFAALGVVLIIQLPHAAGAVILSTALAGLIVVPFLAASPVAFMALTLPLMMVGLLVHLLMPVEGGPIFSAMVFATYCLTTRMVFVHRHALLSSLAGIERSKALAQQREVMLANDTVGIAITEAMRLLTVNERLRHLLSMPSGRGHYQADAREGTRPGADTPARAGAAAVVPDLAGVAAGFGWTPQRLSRLLLRAVQRARRKGVVKLTLPFQGQDGAMRWLKLEARLADPAGLSPQLLWVVSDHTSNRRALEELNFRAQHDALTGLANRHQFSLRARQALLRHGQPQQVQAGRPGEGVAILCVDLDGFKAINDRYGHAIGDEVLVVIARRLVHALRSRDVVARFGGDEFMVLLPMITRAEAAAVVDKLVDVIASPVDIHQARLRVGASVGLAMAPADGDSVEALLLQADRQMYRIKEALKRSMPARGNEISRRL